jgi:hypothetical protein
MTIRSSRGRVRAAVLALCGIAVIATVAVSVSASATTSGRQQTPVASALPVVVACGMKEQIRPGVYVLPCADANAYLSGLRWSTWGPSTALASGTYAFNDCVPSCVAGHGHSFPALAVLWRVQPLPGHHDVRYFTRLTIIYTGNRSYRAGGKLHHLAQTATYPLSQYGGG